VSALIYCPKCGRDGIRTSAKGHARTCTPRPAYPIFCHPESLMPAPERYRWRMLMWRAEDRRMTATEALSARLALIYRAYEFESAAERASNRNPPGANADIRKARPRTAPQR
jgi:hypothetical protein